MEIQVEIDGKEMTATYKGITARLYRENFNRDFLHDLSDIQNKLIKRLRETMSKDEIENVTDDEMLNMLIECASEEYLCRLMWVCLKSTHDLKKSKKKFPSFESFVDGIDDYTEFIGVCLGLYSSIIQSTLPVAESDDDEDEDEKDESEKDEKKMN